MALTEQFKSFYKEAYTSNHFPSIRELSFSKKKIFAYYGFLGDKNFGDELVFEAAQKLFYPDILIPVKKRMPLVLHLYCQIFKAKFSGIVIGGGTLIGPRFWNSKYFEALAKLGKPVYVHGTGVHNKEIFHETWKNLLSKRYYGGVRGPLSEKNLHGLGISSAVIGDAAFIMFDKNDWPLKSKQQHKNILLNIGTHSDFVGKENSRTELLKFIPLLIDKGYKIQFLPFHSIDVHDGLELKLRFPEITILEIPEKYQDCLILFQNCTFAIGERLHFNVMSVLSGRPFLSINYGKKHEDFLNSLDISDAGIDPKNVTCRKLTLAFENRFSFNWEEIGNRLSILQKKQVEQLSFKKDQTLVACDLALTRKVYES